MFLAQDPIPVNTLKELQQGGVVLMLLAALFVVGGLCWYLMRKGWKTEIEYRETIQAQGDRSIKTQEKLVEAITLNTTVMGQVKDALATNAQLLATNGQLKEHLAGLSSQVSVLKDHVADLARLTRERH